MTYIRSKEVRVLAIDPLSRGIAFVVLEGAQNLIDWGIKGAVRNKNAQCLRRLARLIEHYQPEILIVEDTTAKGCRRCLRVRNLIEEILKLASQKKVKTRTFSRLNVRKGFSACSAYTKHQIAVAISQRFPELVPYLPRLRKPWMSEDERMSIFDAAALALTFFYLKKKREPVINPSPTAQR